MARSLLLAALLALLAGSAAGQSLVKRDSMPNITCGSELTRALGKLVTINADNLCANFAFDKPSALGCSVIDLIGMATRQVTGTCSPQAEVQAEVPTTDTHGSAIPARLADRRPLPDGPFPDEAALLAEEGATLYWHIANVINLFMWSPCDQDGRPETVWHLPKGWTVLDTQSVRDALAANATRLPFYSILKSADGRRLAVIIRGTRTALEWAVDLSYQQISDPTYPGTMSKGFCFGANILWPLLEETLRREVVAGQVTDVQISGHSLGAAMATMLSWRAQVLLDKELKAAGKPLVKVDALLFAPPNVGSREFTAAFNARVNARRIAFEYDFVPQVPCAPAMMACKDVQYPTAVKGVTSFPYSQVGGRVTLPAAGMPVQTAAWRKLATINGCSMLDWGIAAHICSYPCFFSRFAGAEAAGRCKLWAEAGPLARPAADPAFCPGFPKRSPEFPLRSAPLGSKLVVGGPLTQAFMTAMHLERTGNSSSEHLALLSKLAKLQHRAMP